MFWQREYVRENVAMTLNSTYIQELPRSGNLGSLLIRVTGSQATNLGFLASAWRIVDFISKVELIGDGSTVIKSFAGDALQAIAFYDQWVTMPDPWRNYGTNTQRAYFLVNFGRWLHDTMLGLDLSRYKTIEIKITNTATSSSFSDLTVSLLGFYLRDQGDKRFTGYLRTEEWRSWTTVAGEIKYHELPVELPIRRILLQANPQEDANGVDTTSMEQLMSTIELTFDTGATKVWNGGLDDLLRENLLTYRSYVLVGGELVAQADRGVRVGVGYIDAFVGGSGSHDGEASGTVPTLEAGRTGPHLKPESYEANSPIQFLAKGAGYHMTAVLPFDQDENPENWLDPNKRKTVQLNITTTNDSESASGTNKIILDRLVRY